MWVEQGFSPAFENNYFLALATAVTPAAEANVRGSLAAGLKACSTRSPETKSRGFIYRDYSNPVPGKISGDFR
jgi:hypothetical protein